MPGPHPPSTYIPFTRRFGSERNREFRETHELYAWVKAYQDAFSETPRSVAKRVYAGLRDLPEDVDNPFVWALHELLAQERHLWELPAPSLDQMTMLEFVEYRNLLHAKQHFFMNQAALLEALQEGLSRCLYGIAAQLPELLDPSPFKIPLIYALSEPRRTVDLLYNTLVDYHDQGLLKAVTVQLYRNRCTASGRDPVDGTSRKPFIAAADSVLPLDRLVDAYLGQTPFRDLFMTPVPLKVSHEERYHHTHLLGGSGAGKTTLIENLIRHDLASPDPPSIVLIDPHSDLVRRLVHSDLGIEDRLILIDPRDIQHPVALNPFAVNRERMATYDETMQEQVTAGVIQTFGYLWNGLTNLTLTGKQEVFFRYVTRLMLTLPHVEGRNATILDILKLMRDPTPYGRAIEALPDIPRDFFVNDFMSKTFEGTKEQIRYRLQAIIENPTIARLFTAPETKVDFFTEMNRGAVILVDTAADFLKEGSAVFGKLMISLILQAVLERAAIPEHRRMPTFIMVDEAGSYFSSNIDDLLTEARKYKAGMLLSHQYLDQASSALRASLAANTGIKFVSGLSAGDASTMAREMRTTPDFIMNQPRLQFAAHIRGVTPTAVSIPVSLIRGSSTLSSSAFASLMERNRKRVSLAGQEALPAPKKSPPDTPPDPDEDISGEW